jgi:hypothetical protein
MLKSTVNVIGMLIVLLTSLPQPSRAGKPGTDKVRLH